MGDINLPNLFVILLIEFGAIVLGFQLILAQAAFVLLSLFTGLLMVFRQGLRR